MRTPAALIAVYAASASSSTAAHANGAVEEVSAGASASSSWLADRLGGIWEIDDRWELRADFTATRSYARSDTATSLQTSASLEYAPDPHWTFRLGAGWAPATTAFASERVEADGLPEAEAYLRARSASGSLSLGVAYDTAGTSDYETTVSVGITGTYYAALQHMLALRAGDEVLAPREVMEHCAAYVCDELLEAVLAPQETQLVQLALDASVTETAYEDTDLTLAATYYIYDIDPTEAGYVALASFGPGNLGSALGLVATDYAVSPSVAHRFGRLSVTASGSYGSYVGAQGYVLSANLRVQYKLALADDRRLKVYMKLGGSWNVDGDNELAPSGSLATGVQYSW